MPVRSSDVPYHEVQNLVGEGAVRRRLARLDAPPREHDPVEDGDGERGDPPKTDEHHPLPIGIEHRVELLARDGRIENADRHLHPLIAQREC